MPTSAVVVHEHGGPETLRLEEVPTPTPAAGEVLVAVEAVGVAYADVLMRRGLYPETPKLPFTPGYDLETAVRRLAPDGVDATFDAVGGPQLAASRRMTRRGGTVVSYGVGFGAGKDWSRIGLLGRHGAALAKAKLTPGATVRMYVIAGRRGAADEDPAALREDLGALVALVADGSLTPEVTTLPLADIADAHRRLESGKVPGKLVLRVDAPG